MKVLKIVFGVIVTAALIGAAGTIIQNAQQKKDEENSKEENDNEPPAGCLCSKARFKEITKNLIHNIEEIEERTSDENHRKRQKEYDSMKWERN